MHLGRTLLQASYIVCGFFVVCLFESKTGIFKIIGSHLQACRWPLRLPQQYRAPLPTVIWHGLGDSAYSPWLIKLKEDIEDMYPGIYVHLISLDSTPSGDKSATFMGNVNEQIEQAQRQLAKVPELQAGFDAIGFSQGGQFFRGYVERFNTPRVRNLVTFGSQHMGITQLPGCAEGDRLCNLVMRSFEGRMYSDFAQTHLVVAQYFRDTRLASQYQQYEQRNRFLYDINNEGPSKQELYKKNMKQLEKFAMIRFSEEETVVPSESAWFSAYEDPEHRRDDEVNMTVPLRTSRLYNEDWIGLQHLDARGGLAFHMCEGQHMQLSPACKSLVFHTYVGHPRFDEASMNRLENFMNISLYALICIGLMICMQRLYRSPGDAKQVTAPSSLGEWEPCAKHEEAFPNRVGTQRFPREPIYGSANKPHDMREVSFVARG